jgi:hypothetical protein
MLQQEPLLLLEVKAIMVSKLEIGKLFRSAAVSASYQS